MNVYLGELYKEVEYIQSSGTQYIDTGIKGDISSYLSVDYKFTLVQNKSSGQQSIFGNIGGSGQGLAIYWDANSNQQGTWCGTGTGWYPGYITVGSVTTINATFNKTSGRTFSINGTTYTSSASNPSIDNGLNYFIFNDGRSSLAGYFKIYYFKIYKDGTLVRDFIPCYRVSDNVIGLFDKVENKFYTNAGTGTFTKGNDVKIFQPVLKNAYIGEYTGIVCDFTQSDYGFTWLGSNGATPTYGRNSGGLYMSYSDSTVNKIGAWKIPSSIYSQGNIKKIELTLYSTATQNGGGFGNVTSAYDYCYVRTWQNVIDKGYNGSWTHDTAVNPANQEFKIIIDISNGTTSVSSGGSGTINSNILNWVNSNWPLGHVSLVLLRAKNSGTIYCRNATFYF